MATPGCASVFASPVPVVDLPSPRQWTHEPPSNLLDGLIRFTPVPTVVLDASLRIYQVSESYVLVSGAGDGEKLVGQHADSVFSQLELFPPHATARLAIRSALSSARMQQIKHLTPANTAWTVRAVPVIRHGVLQCIQMEFHDITEEHRKQLELEERHYTNETFRILVETVRDYAIFMLDPKGHIATWNAGAQKFKGWQPHQIIGKHFSTFYGEEDRKAEKPARELRDALRDGRCEDEGWRYRSDGSRFWANVVITPVYKDDVLLGFSKVTRDLTERRKAVRNQPCTCSIS